jgi:hypothetical protein
MPARAAYAAVDAAALPDESSIARRTPHFFKCEIRMVEPRSLKDPLGRR